MNEQVQQVFFSAFIFGQPHYEVAAMRGPSWPVSTVCHQVAMATWPDHFKSMAASTNSMFCVNWPKIWL